MNIEDKYKKLRAAMVQLIGVKDDKGVLLALLGEMHKMGVVSDADGVASIQVILALIETSGEAS